MKRKILNLVCLTFIIALSALVFLSCENNSSENLTEENSEFMEVYKIYAAYAEENDETPLSYSEWLEQILGKDGANGSNGKSAYEIYKDMYGYDGTEEQWINALSNGELSSENFTVSFDLKGGSGNIENQNIKNLKKVKEPDAPVKTGYTFLGWYSGNERWLFSGYLVTDDTVLSAKWQANEYEVDFDSDGGNEISAKTVIYDENYYFDAPARDEYIFLGWYFGEEKIENSGKWKIAETVTLKAKWVIAKSTITFTTYNGETIPDMTINYGKDYKLPTIEKENMIFDGWYLGEEKWTDGKILTGDINLTAKWKSANAVFDYEEKDGEITITKFRGGEKDVIIPKTLNKVPVTNIDESAFKNNTEIESITFDGSFENYSDKMLEGCNSLKKLTLSGVYDKALYRLFGDDVSAVPESLIAIQFAKNSPYYDNDMFKYQMANRSITLIIDYGISARAFENCNGLTSVTIGDGVTSIGDEAFGGCSGLSSITIPNSVTSIGNAAFQNCSGLTSIDIPDSVTSIGDQAFYNCSGLSSIDIPDGVTSIGNAAFQNCYRLTSIDIPDGVTSIGSHAFEQCRKLTSITIPDGVTSIGSYAFWNCSGLTSISFKGTKEQWQTIEKDKDWKFNVSSNCKVYCADGKVISL